MQKNPARFFVVFALFWSAIVLVFDVHITRTFYHQTLSLRYASTQGRIISSEITTNPDSEGSTTYGARIVYEFSVGGRRYQSDRVRFGQGADSSGRWATETVQANPPGSIRTVYHDASDPSLSVLQPGASGQDWFLALFITPFNVVMVFLWTLALAARRPSPPRGGARVVTESGRLLVFFPGMTSAGAALLAFGGVSFAGIFVLLFSSGFSPKIEHVWATWGLAALAAIYAATKTRPGKTTSVPDLIIDSLQGTLSLPRGHADAIKSWSQWRDWKNTGQPALVVPLEHIRAAAVQARVSDSGDGKSTRYVVALTVAGSDTEAPHEYDLGSWMLPGPAELFAAWLRETLGLRSAPGDLAPSS